MSKVNFYFNKDTQSHIWTCLKQTIIFWIFKQQIMNCDFKEIIVFNDFLVENGVLGLERDVYLNVVKFLNSSVLRNV
jgi:hypothetical protein